MHLIVFFNLVMSVNRFEMELALKLKQEIEKKIDQKHGGFFSFKPDNIKFLNISVRNNWVFLEELDYSDHIEGSMNNKISQCLLNEFYYESEMDKVMELIKRQLKGVSSLDLIFNDSDKSQNIELLKKVCETLKEKLKNVTVRNKADQVVSLCGPMNANTDITWTSPYSELKPNRLIYKLRLKSFGSHMIFYYCFFDLTDNFIIKLLDDFTRTTTYFNVIKYTKRRLLNKNLKPLDSIYEMFPRDCVFEDKLDGLMFSETFLLKKRLSYQTESSSRFVSGLSVDLFEKTLKRLTASELCGICVLLYQTLNNKKLFVEIITKATYNMSYEQSCLLNLILTRVLSSPSINKMEKSVFVNSDSLIPEKLFNLLQPRVYTRTVGLNPFLTYFYIVSCEYFQTDLIETITKMSNDFTEGKVFNVNVSKKAAQKSLLKAATLLQLQIDNKEQLFSNLSKYRNLFSKEILNDKNLDKKLGQIQIEDVHDKIARIYEERFPEALQ